MKNNLTFILLALFLLPLTLGGQDVEPVQRKLKFSVYGGYSLFNMGTHTKTSSSNFYNFPLQQGSYYEKGQIFDIIDEKVVNEMSTATSSSVINLGVNYKLPLSNRLSLYHGLDFNLFKYEFEKKEISRFNTMTAQLTIIESGVYDPFQQSIYNYTFFNPEIEFEFMEYYNYYDPYDGLSVGLTNSFGLDYSITKKFGIQLGAYLGAQLYQRINGLVESNFEGYIVTSSIDLSQIMTGLDGAVRYDINSKSSISFQLRKSMINYFSKQSLAFDIPGNVLPISYGLRYAYTINPSKVSDVSPKRKGPRKTRKQ